jgi:hypothetical protein
MAMIKRRANRLTMGLVLFAVVAALEACGGSTPSALTSQTTQRTVKSPPPGAGDAAICNLISKAETTSATGQWTAWRLQMAQIGAMARSAQYVPIRTAAQALEKVYAATSTTTTTAATSRPKRHSSVATSFTGVYAYAELKSTCAKVLH